MEKTTQNPEQSAGEIYAVEMNKEDSSDKDVKISREPVKGTPFYVVGSEEKGYFIALGQNRITEQKETPGKAINELTDKKWEIIANMIVIITGAMKQVTTSPQEPEGEKNTQE